MFVLQTNKLGLAVLKEFPIPVVFEEVKMDCGYRADLKVENKVIVEAKSIDAIAGIHVIRTLTYYDSQIVNWRS